MKEARYSREVLEEPLLFDWDAEILKLDKGCRQAKSPQDYPKITNDDLPTCPHCGQGEVPKNGRVCFYCTRAFYIYGEMP